MNGAPATPSIWGTLIPFIALIAVFYFMMIRPQQTQKKKRDAMLAALRKGNRVVTIGGIYGEIIDIKDEVILLDVANQGERMVMRFGKWAVQDVLGKENQSKDNQPA